MHYFIYTIVAWALVYFLVGGKFFKVWKAGLIGVVLTVLADYFGTKYNLYAYPRGIIYLGRQPLFHIVNAYAVSLLFLAWLPGRWDKRFLYTVYMSTIFLAVEAVMYSLGVIVYPHWRLWYSWFLDIAGLTLLALLTDLLFPPIAAAPAVKGDEGPGR
ncbi:MAG: hypothetical protein ACOY40_12360 [Bacillota bacterium]